MNDIYSNPEIKYRPRWLGSLLKEAVADHPVVILTGARQVGKSTLLMNELPFSKWRYLTFDDFDLLAQARRNPDVLLAGDENFVLDEVQKAPAMINAVKAKIDRAKNKSKLILSGSANLNLMQKISESLAGRAVYFTLQPMAIGEALVKSPPQILVRLFSGQRLKEQTIPARMDPLQFMWKGLMPSLLRIERAPSVLQWWEGYIMTYLERDLRQLSQIESLPDYRRLMTALALRCCTMLNQSEISRDIGISQPTIHRYINLMELTHLVLRLPAFSVNRTKRLMKAPKIIWIDPGLVSFLAGYYDVEQLKLSKISGFVFESLVYVHLLILTQLMIPRPHIYYWRTSNGKEVDFILEWGRKLLAIEVKLSGKAYYSDIQNLNLFLQEYPETIAGLLIYTGNDIVQLGDKIYAVPWHVLAGVGKSSF